VLMNAHFPIVNTADRNRPRSTLVSKFGKVWDTLLCLGTFFTSAGISEAVWERSFRIIAEKKVRQSAKTITAGSVNGKR
jgi:hypothetical protein